jgi:DNA-binding LacI/PurR family transcriptional regulator
VAKIAGVSSITVSRTVNRPEMVTPATLMHVRQAIERTGYVPNLLAGALASNRTRLVAAIVPANTNAIFVETVQALTDRLWTAGYQVLLAAIGWHVLHANLRPCQKRARFSVDQRASVGKGGPKHAKKRLVSYS